MIGLTSLLLLLFGSLFFILFLYSLSKQRNSLSAPFSILCLAVSVYIIGYSLELHADSIEQIKLYLKLQYFGAPFMSALWLLFSYKYHHRRSAPLKLVLFIMVIPVVTVFLSATNEYHHLIYADVSAVERDGFLLSVLEKGSWYPVYFIFSFLVQLMGILTFFSAWHKEKYCLWTQACFFSIGSIWPGIASLIYISGMLPNHIDLTPFGLSITAVFFSIAVFRKGLFELKEIVKDVTFLEINEGIIVADEQNRLIDFNHAAKNLFPCLDKSRIGQELLLCEDNRNIFLKEENLFEMLLIINGTKRCYEFRKTVLEEKSHTIGAVYFVQDISKQKEMIQALNNMANYDYLTLIYNRRKWIEEAEKELMRSIRYGSSLSLLMIDIDRFKLVNDIYGHQAGDEVLKTVAEICKSRIRRTDILGRYGGEEFMAILPESGERSAFLIAEELRTQIAETPILFEEYDIHITVSIGLATTYFKNDNISIDFLISCADHALYQAKNNGRNRTEYYK